MNHRVITVASFISYDEMTDFLTHLKENFNITDTLIFSDIENRSSVIVLFKTTLIDGERLNMHEISLNSVVVHKKGTAIYTINALNKLIEYDINENIGNIVYETYKIDWSKYQNKVIITKNNELLIINTERIFI